MPAVDGILNLVKAPGMTSHDAVNRVRRILGTRSVGHAGTLDPAAAGVLPMAVGKATRLLEYLLMADKVYIAEVTFGLQTDTSDQSGKIVSRRPARFDEPALQAALASLVGRRQQTPPAYSAIKHQGRPLYDYARAGESVSVAAREIEIKQLQMVSFAAGEYPTCLLRVECSKGTYVRVLAEEIAQRLQTVAVLSFLLRTSVGDWRVADAVTLEELAAAVASGELHRQLRPLDSAVQHLPEAILPPTVAAKFLNGQPVAMLQAPAAAIRVYQGNLLLGIASSDGGWLRPHKVLATQEELAR